MGEAPESASPFAVLLRRHRLRLHLTQEALAERAGLSSRSVAEMERGRGRSPRPRSVEQLVVALGLNGDEREEFVEAGHALFWASRAGRPDRRDPALGYTRVVDPPPRQLPADLPDFVGREDELSLVSAVLDPVAKRDARLVVLSGPPGVGKTALAVHAGHRFASWFPAGQLYVVLRDAAARSLRIRGKRNKERYVYLASSAVGRVEAWLTVRGSDLGGLFAPFTPRGGHIRRTEAGAVAHMSGQTVGDVIANRAEQAGFAEAPTRTTSAAPSLADKAGEDQTPAATRGSRG